MQTFQYSDAGLALTKSFEGLRLRAYQDSGGVWTIGYGHAGPEVHAGLVWTEAQADAALREDLREAEACVNSAVSVAITQHQFDAMVDFTYNCGRGNFLSSTLLRKLNEHDYAGAAEEFGKWDLAGGHVVEGLERRRQAEETLDVEAGADRDAERLAAEAAMFREARP